MAGEDGAGRSRPAPREGRARTPGACPADSDRRMARTWTAAAEAACSTCPSWAALLSGGDGAMWTGVHTDEILTRSRLATCLYHCYCHT
uniref:Uncharacterized protein n=1 Tax=Cyclopterus lumpus TaxID=8103 RepID=A0A8C2WIR5_CYCLU